MLRVHIRTSYVVAVSKYIILVAGGTKRDSVRYLLLYTNLSLRIPHAIVLCTMLRI